LAPGCGINFFRENNHFEYLTDAILPELKQKCYKNGNLNIRAWSAACSTGEEPYTIAMVLKDYFKNNTGWNIRVLASDIDTNVLKKASEGIYSFEQAKDIPIDLLIENFYKGEEKNEGLFKSKEKLKEMVVFKKINLIDDTYPIDAPLDVIFCRNVFIYFDQETVNKVINKFYHYLKTGGYLFLGHSESLDFNGEYKDKFKMVAHTVYCKL
jgi:chemotaxis protein methyltransferase CheR